MAESPLARLSRLLGGVVLTHGRFPHQVLGQLLIADSTSVELAGANMAIVASSGHRSALADAAVRTAAPAIAIQILAQKQEARLRRLATIAETSAQRLEFERDRIRNERLEKERTFNRTEQTLLTLDDRERELADRAEQLDARDAEIDALFESRVLELEARAQAVDDQSIELTKRAGELDAKAVELTKRTAELDALAVELKRRASELDALAVELERRARELEERERELADSPAQSEPPRAEPKPKPKPPPKKSRSKKKPSGGPK